MKLSKSLVYITIIAALCVYFRKLLSTALIAGWDTPGHYYLLLQRAQNPLPWKNVYDPNVFAGIGLFNLYSPFYYTGVAAIWHLTLRVIPLTFLFNLSVLVPICVFPFVFMYFCKVYLGDKYTTTALIFSVFYLFYPIGLSYTGVGAGAGTYMGLVVSTYGVILSILTLALFKTYLLDPSNTKKLKVFSISLSILVVTHMLSTLFTILVLIVVFAFERPSLTKLIVKVPLAVITFLVIAGPWVINFIQSFPHSSSQTLTAVTVFRDTFLILFPVNAYILKYLPLVWYFRYWVVFLAALFLSEVISGRGEKKTRLLITAILASYLMWLTNLIPVTTNNSLNVHFHRAIPLIFILTLAIATGVFVDAFEKSSRVGRGVLLILLAFSATNAIVTFNVIQYDYTQGFSEKLHRTIDSVSYLKDQSYYDEVTKLVDFLKIQGGQRVFVQAPSDLFMSQLGTLHYFNYAVPAIAGTGTISGLLAEASPLTPYIMATTYATTGGQTQIWGSTKLAHMGVLIGQDISNHLARLNFLGVSTIVTSTKDLATRLSKRTELTKVYSSTHFTVFKFKETQPLCYALNKKPVGLLHGNDSKRFDTVSTAFFIGKASYAIPIIELPTNTNEHIQVDKFSAIIAYEDQIDELDANRVGTTPIVILNPSSTFDELKPRYLEQRVIYNFKDIGQVEGAVYAEPTGWSEVRKAVNKAAGEYADPIPVKCSFADQKFTLTTRGNEWIFLRFGYSNLLVANCKSCQLYQMSPGYTGIYNPDLEKEISISVR